MSKNTRCLFTLVCLVVGMFPLVFLALRDNPTKSSTPLTSYDYYYPNLQLTVKFDNKLSIEKICGGISRLDDGSASNNAKFDGCYFSETRTIYVRVDMPELLVHELCHAGGSSPLQCDRVYLPRVK